MERKKEKNNPQATRTSFRLTPFVLCVCAAAVCDDLGLQSLLYSRRPFNDLFVNLFKKKKEEQQQQQQQELNDWPLRVQKWS